MGRTHCHIRISSCGITSGDKEIKDSFKYGFTTCAVAYLLAALPALFVSATFLRGLSEPLVDFREMFYILSFGLSDFSLWGNFYYLSIVVPWIVSSYILGLLVDRFDGGQGKKVLFSGIGMSIYYVIMLMIFIISGTIFGFGDVAYEHLWFWPFPGFIMGVTASILVSLGQHDGTD